MFIPGSLEQKKLHEHMRGAQEINRTPSTFDTLPPIDMIFGTNNEMPLFFQLSVTTWPVISFYGSHKYIKYVPSGRLLGFLIFRILFKLGLYY